MGIIRTLLLIILSVVSFWRLCLHPFSLISKNTLFSYCIKGIRLICTLWCMKSSIYVIPTMIPIKLAEESDSGYGLYHELWRNEGKINLKVSHGILICPINRVHQSAYRIHPARFEGQASMESILDKYPNN